MEKWKLIKRFASSLMSIMLLSSCNNAHDDQIISDDLQRFILEVDGVSRDIAYARVSLQSDTSLINVFFEEGAVENRITANIEPIPTGAYEVVISIFEGENLLPDSENARGTLHKGIEHTGYIVVNNDQGRVIVQGPDSNYDVNILPIWTERFYYSFKDESISEELVLNVPNNPCQLNISFLPSLSDKVPVYTYMDYFIRNENNSNYTHFIECHSGCDPRTQLNKFAQQLMMEASDLCRLEAWTTADMMIILDYGDEVEDVVFFMRWDPDGANLGFLDNGRLNADETNDRVEARKTLNQNENP